MTGGRRAVWRLLTWQAVRAVPLGLAPPALFALVEVLERSQWEALGEALCRSVLLVGPVCPLLVVVAVIGSLRAREVWVALRLLGYGDRGLLLPLLLVGLGLAVSMAVLSMALPSPSWTDGLPPMPVADGEGWRVPLGDGLFRVDPARDRVEALGPAALTGGGQGWTTALRWTFVARAGALLSFAPWWARASRPDGAVSLSGAFASFVALALVAVLAQSILGLLVEAGAVGAWEACGGLVLGAALGGLLWCGDNPL